MTKTISASAMRDRLLMRLQAPPRSDDWVRVLGTPGHRELLALIAGHHPASVGALAVLAGRAQPNVSRALNALVSAGLVEVVSHGRRSIPRITEVGAGKVRDLGLTETSEDLGAATGQAAELFSIDVAEKASSGENPENDAIDGQLTCWLWLSSSKERAAARTETDLDALGRRVLENWWRLLYRRDAPFRLWDFTLEDQLGSSYALLAAVTGSKLNMSARADSGNMLDFEHASKTFQVSAFEELLLVELLRPLAAHHWLQGRSARPLHALLARIEDSRDQPSERAFCRTAGALGLTAYNLGDDRAAQIRDLLEFIPEEDARLDFSSAVLAGGLDEGQLWTNEQLKRFRQRNAMPVLAKLRAQCRSDLNARVRPYRHGYDLARKARDILKLAEDQPLGGVEGVSKLLGAGAGIGLSPKAPGSLRAFQGFDNGSPTIIVEDEGARRSAYILARGIGDFLAFGSRAACVADLYTDRQAVGRAFAAEFMVPRDAVVRMVEEEDQSIAQIADHYGVLPTVVHHQYDNSSR